MASGRQRKTRVLAGSHGPRVLLRLVIVSASGTGSNRQHSRRAQSDRVGVGCRPVGAAGSMRTLGGLPNPGTMTSLRSLAAR